MIQRVIMKLFRHNQQELGTYQSGDVTPSSWLPSGDTLRPELEPEPGEKKLQVSTSTFSLLLSKSTKAFLLENLALITFGLKYHMKITQHKRIHFAQSVSPRCWNSYSSNWSSYVPLNARCENLLLAHTNTPLLTILIFPPHTYWIYFVL